jgi:PleD family two-component response regulator
VLIVQGHARSPADTAATRRAEGHDVLEAGSADHCVRLAHEEGPEVILLDPMLPDRSGYELYASLQRDPMTLAIPVLFLPASPPPGASQPAARVVPRRRHHRPLRGEAFLMLLPGTRLDAAWNVAERVRRRTAAVGIVLGPDAPRLTASFGVVEHRPADGWRDLLARADTALERAKRAGCNRCEVASQARPRAPPYRISSTIARICFASLGRSFFTTDQTSSLSMSKYP